MRKSRTSEFALLSAFLASIFYSSDADYFDGELFEILVWLIYSEEGVDYSIRLYEELDSFLQLGLDEVELRQKATLLGMSWIPFDNLTHSLTRIKNFMKTVILNWEFATIVNIDLSKKLEKLEKMMHT